MLAHPKPVNMFRTAWACLLLLALAGCRDDAADRSPVATVDGPVVAQSSEGEGGFTARIAGALTMSGGCLFVGEVPVIWPYGSTWDAQRRAVRLADGQVVDLGDRVIGSGGYLHLSELSSDFAEPLLACPTNTYDEVAMFDVMDRPLSADALSSADPRIAAWSGVPPNSGRSGRS